MRIRRRITVDAEIDLSEISTADLLEELNERHKSVSSECPNWLTKFAEYYGNSSLGEQMECELLLTNRVRGS